MTLQHFELKLDAVPNDKEHDNIAAVFGSSAISGTDLNGVGTIAVSHEAPTYEGARLRAVLDANKAGFRVNSIVDAPEVDYDEHFAVLERALAETFNRDQLRVRLQILVWDHVRKTEQLRSHIRELEEKLNPSPIDALLDEL
jgi:uncharacterized protein YqgV (UPF0045/DUF77 family)